MVLSYDVFTGIVRCSFLGGKQVFNLQPYSLEPTIIRRYDLLRKKPEFGSKTEMNRLFSTLTQEFKKTAGSELYRKDGGWIEKSYNEKKVKQFQINQDFFLVPMLNDQPAIGIDSSRTFEDTYICFAFFDNHSAAYHYIENILKIPKSKHKWTEFKWNKLDKANRKLVNDKAEYLLKMSCQCVLMIKTNAFFKSEEKFENIFDKLIQGLFTNYNYKSQDRLRLRNYLFKLANDVRIHCDADFNPLTPDKIVKFLVKILADGVKCDPVHLELESHESEPIQIADILCGMFKEQILSKNFSFIQPWEFDSKLKSKKLNRDTKCYFWENKNIPF